MTRRKLLIALLVAGALSIGLGNSLMSASADFDVKVRLPNGLIVVERLPECVPFKDGEIIECKPAEGPPPASTTPGQPPEATDPVAPPQPAPQPQQQPPAQPQPPAQQPQTPTSPPATIGKPQPEPEGQSGPGGKVPGNSDENEPTRPESVLGPSRGEGGQAPRRPRKRPKRERDRDEDDDRERRRPPIRAEDGRPTLDNPSLSIASPGAAPIGVPNFFIDKFRIPPFLLPIYQAAGTEYGIPWQVLAAINEIETDYGRNLNVSSAGAMGWMQFIPSSWRAYGVDANGDGIKDPYNPVDAIFAAARYLKAADAHKDLRRAIYAYNHAWWYVDSVMLRARLIGGMPADLVGSLTGLTQGRFPVAARAAYANDLNEREATKRVAPGENAANVVEGTTRNSINIFAKSGAPVIAVNDGTITAIGESKRLGKYVTLTDVYGNRYTYGHLGKIAPTYPAPKPQPVNPRTLRSELEEPPKDPQPRQAASAGRQPPKAPKRRSVPRAPAQDAAPAATVYKERLFAHPARPNSRKAGGEQQLLQSGKPVAGYETYSAYFAKVLGLDSKDVVLKKLQKGSPVIAGTVLGRIERVDRRLAPHVAFEIRPAGEGSPRIDPKPILDGWKLLESTAIYRAAGKNPFFGPDAKNPTIGQILLMSKEALERRVLSDPRIEIYPGGRQDIRSGQIDRRVLAGLAFLSSSGLRPSVSSMKSGHSYYTTAGTVSWHSSGNAVDIWAVNGTPILGHQGPGSITDVTVRRLLTLQGVMRPGQIITLYQYPGHDNTLAMSDHHDHIHVGWPPHGSASRLGRQYNAVLKPGQWIKLVERLNEIDNPTVPVKPSRFSIRVGKRPSEAHAGE